jgi:hypothetical protein
MPEEPSDLAVDLWLVLCAGTPPAPPPWKVGVGGDWAIFPGAATQWVPSTRSATEAWDPTYVLTDRFPDEDVPSLWFNWWSEREFIWLPTWVRSSAPERKRTILTVVRDNRHASVIGEVVTRVMADRAGCAVVDLPVADAGLEEHIGSLVASTERLFLDVADPLRIGMILHASAKAGVEVFSSSVLPRGLRQACLGGGREVHLPVGKGRISPLLRTMVAHMMSGEGAVAEPVLEATWEEWVGSFCGVPSPGGSACLARILMSSLRPDVALARLPWECGWTVGAACVRWYRRSVRELWRQERSAELEFELDLVTNLVMRQIDREVPDWIDVYFYCFLTALRADLPALGGALASFKEINNGDTREVPAAAALALAARGRRMEAAALLRQWPTRGDSGVGAFWQSVAWLILGDEATALKAMRTCLTREPGFLLSGGAYDPRLHLAAVAARAVGLCDLSACLWRMGVDRWGEELFGHLAELCKATPVGRSGCSEEWAALLAVGGKQGGTEG